MIGRNKRLAPKITVVPKPVQDFIDQLIKDVSSPVPMEGAEMPVEVELEALDGILLDCLTCGGEGTVDEHLVCPTCGGAGTEYFYV